MPGKWSDQHECLHFWLAKRSVNGTLSKCTSARIADWWFGTLLKIEFLKLSYVGLSPDPAKHGFFIDIHPKLGIPARLAVRMQINIAVRRDDEVPWSPSHEDQITYYPQLWFSAVSNEWMFSEKLPVNSSSNSILDQTAELDDASARELLLLERIPTYLLIVACIAWLIGVIILIVTLRCFYEDIAFKLTNHHNEQRATKRALAADAIRDSEMRNLTAIQFQTKIARASWVAVLNSNW